jgi:hypothetical protein
MAQHDYIISNATFPAVRTDINNALSAIQTTNSGTSRPTGAVAGQLWLDTTSATTPTLKYYDGADDISLATIDHSANTVNWLDSTVSITGLSTTATGTVLTLSDSVNTTTVNLIIDNQKEIRFRETTANGTNYVALKAPALLASDLTFTLPSSDGTSGQLISTNGSGVLSFATVTADGTADWDTSVKTTGFTATANKGYFCNTTSAGFTVTLPATPSAGDEIIILDYAGTFDTNALSISPNGNKIEGATSDLQLTGEREGVRLVYIDSTQGWLAYSGINEGTDALSPLPLDVEYLVVAGGGGATQRQGAGGAGGFRTGTLTSLAQATNFTVTVGGGGASGSGVNGTSGSNSVFSTITSAGGGGGGDIQANGLNGGSGGGGGHQQAGGSTSGGSGNTPSTSPSQGSNGGKGLDGNVSPYSGGGGGGASATGSGASGSGGGNGGNGSASSITGSSVTYAGGGGGGAYQASVASTGGTGGGGNGGALGGDNNGSAGGTNTGGGGGGGHRQAGTDPNGGAGGSGIVILKYTDNFTISNPAGGLTFTTSTSGGYKITSFTAGTGNVQWN